MLQKQRRLEQSLGVADPDGTWHRSVYNQPLETSASAGDSSRFVARGVVGTPHNFQDMPHQYVVYVHDSKRPFEIKFYGEK